MKAKTELFGYHPTVLDFANASMSRVTFVCLDCYQKYSQMDTARLLKARTAMDAEAKQEEEEEK